MSARTLLEKAKAAPGPHRGRHGNVTEGDLELIEAVVRGDVTIKQAAYALGMKHSGNFVQWTGANLCAAIRQGMLKRVKP